MAAIQGARVLARPGKVVPSRRPARAQVTRAVLAVLSAAALGACVAPQRPAEAGEQSCVNLSQQMSSDLLAAASAWTSADVVAYRIQCTVPIFNDRSGSLWTNIVWSDRTRTEPTYGWGNGFDAASLRDALRPLPAPPIPPTCLGVPADQCQDCWSQAMVGDTAAQIPTVTAVRVECTTTCSAESGEARTVVQFQDASTVTVSTSSYDAAPEIARSP